MRPSFAAGAAAAAAAFGVYACFLIQYFPNCVFYILRPSALLYNRNLHFKKVGTEKIETKN